MKKEDLNSATIVLSSALASMLNVKDLFLENNDGLTLKYIEIYSLLTALVSKMADMDRENQEKETK